MVPPESGGEIKASRTGIALLIMYLSGFCVLGSAMGIREVPKGMLKELWYSAMLMMGLSNLFAFKAMYDWIGRSNEARSARTAE